MKRYIIAGAALLGMTLMAVPSANAGTRVSISLGGYQTRPVYYQPAPYYGRPVYYQPVYRPAYRPAYHKNGYYNNGYYNRGYSRPYNNGHYYR